MSIISIYGDGGDGLPKGDRRAVAEFANMLADSALFYGKNSVRELIVLFARHVVDYPHELSEPLKRLTNGLGEMEKRTRERTSINIGQAQDIVTDGGTKIVRNINDEIKE